MLSASLIKQKAEELGFSACGIAPAEPISEERVAMREWMLSHGHHAGMNYLERNEEKRRNPRLLVEGARSIVSLAVPYAPRHADAPPIAAYALGPDYHDTVKALLFKLAEAIDAPEGSRCFVDTAPIDERYWAWRSGIGFIGRSGMLIVPRLGSRVFLGELVLTDEVDAYDAPLTSDIIGYKNCGTCHRCIEACPGKALREFTFIGESGQNNTAFCLDARRCLSYLTIEHRGELPASAIEWMHSSPGTPLFYGCDRCTELCPYNKVYKVYNEVYKVYKVDWEHLSEEDYRELFRGSAVKRAKYEGLMRNIRAFFK